MQSKVFSFNETTRHFFNNDRLNPYVYDPEKKVVGQRKVTITNVEGNSLEIIGDLKAGEIIATAGVSFLHDGMRVDLFDPATLR